jgi:hypothetical protein
MECKHQTQQATLSVHSRTKDVGQGLTMLENLAYRFHNGHLHMGAMVTNESGNPNNPALPKKK